jgi:hypothetical protein
LVTDAAAEKVRVESTRAPAFCRVRRCDWAVSATKVDAPGNVDPQTLIRLSPSLSPHARTSSVMPDLPARNQRRAALRSQRSWRGFLFASAADDFHYALAIDPRRK